MPWQCQKCKKTVLDDHNTCPTCAKPKTAWTIVGDQTRALVVAARKFTCMRGKETSPPSAGSSYDKATWEQSLDASVLPKAKVQELANNNQLPAPHDVVQVRVTPRKHKNWRITLTPKLSSGKIQDQTFDLKGASVTPEGYFDARFLFVHGKEDVSRVQLRGLQIVDVGQEDGAGFAATVDVVAVKKKRQSLKLKAGEIGAALKVHLLDEKGGNAAGEKYRVTLPGGKVVEDKLDPDGSAEIACASGDCQLEFPDLIDSWEPVNPKGQAVHASPAPATRRTVRGGATVHRFRRASVTRLTVKVAYPLRTRSPGSDLAVLKNTRYDLHFGRSETAGAAYRKKYLDQRVPSSGEITIVLPNGVTTAELVVR